MLKKILLLIFLFSTLCGHAQLEVAKMIGKYSSEYNIGFGAFLKVGYPISQASDISIEGNALFFISKNNDLEGLTMVPIKLGYRYTVNGSGTGIYVEPQAGYNFLGAHSNNGELPYKGPALAFGTGYLFEPGAKGFQFDINLRYESIFFSGGPSSLIALRFSHNFMFKRRESNY